MDWLRSPEGGSLSEEAACGRVGSEFVQECGSCDPVACDPTYVDPPDPSHLVWSDEFDYEGAPDATKWEYQTTCNAWVHDDEHLELQHYTERNAVVEDGCLKITARLEEEEGCAYTSSRLRTQYKGDWLYGRIEVCAKLPAHHRGLWPAIWLLPTDDEYGHWPSSGEVDIMEHVGWKPKGTVHAGVHTRTSNHRDKTHRTSSTVVDDAHDAFHVYALVWRPDRMDVFVDGDLVHTVLRSEEGDWPFDKRFYLLLNVAVGGKWAGKHGVDAEAFHWSAMNFERHWRQRVAVALGRGQALIVTQAAERAHRKREPVGRQSREHCPYDAW